MKIELSSKSDTVILQDVWFCHDGEYPLALFCETVRAFVEVLPKEAGVRAPIISYIKTYGLAGVGCVDLLKFCTGGDDTQRVLWSEVLNQMCDEGIIGVRGRNGLGYNICGQRRDVQENILGPIVLMNQGI